MNAFSHTPPDLQPVASGWGREEFTAPARGSCVSIPLSLHCIHISPDEDGFTAMPEEMHADSRALKTDLRRRTALLPRHPLRTYAINSVRGRNSSS